MLGSAAKQAYSRHDVRRMLGLSEQQLRSWQRQGFIPEEAVFSFSDLIALRTLQKLRENRIPPKQIGRALVSLKQKLSEVERPLSELKILSDGRRISVQIAGQRMEAITGQMLFDFDTAELGHLKSFPKKSESSRAGQHQQADLWFQRGLELEETGAPVREAIEAYRNAVDLNPFAAGALVNLGTIYYHLHNFLEAETFYRRAIEADPKYSLAFFNLGNLFDERGDLTEARVHYTQALRLNPHYGDAHFNLALLCEREEDFMQAARHWKAYLKEDPAGSWAAIARRQLEKLRTLTLVQPR